MDFTKVYGVLVDQLKLHGKDKVLNRFLWGLALKHVIKYKENVQNMSGFNFEVMVPEQGGKVVFSLTETGSCVSFYGDDEPGEGSCELASENMDFPSCPLGNGDDFCLSLALSTMRWSGLTKRNNFMDRFIGSFVHCTPVMIWSYGNLSKKSQHKMVCHTCPDEYKFSDKDEMQGYYEECLEASTDIFLDELATVVTGGFFPVGLKSSWGGWYLKYVRYAGPLAGSSGFIVNQRFYDRAQNKTGSRVVSMVEMDGDGLSFIYEKPSVYHSDGCTGSAARFWRRDHNERTGVELRAGLHFRM
uniref:ORF1 n=1 Tax=Isavirus salaris TaxID=55987 RepID=A0A192ZHW2_9ORTO|nr:ORF1 [Isavirus salaris]